MKKRINIIPLLLLFALTVLASSCEEKKQATSKQQEKPKREIPSKFKKVSSELANQKGCLSCHDGIEVISETMQPFLLAQVGGKEGFECAVCHEGNAKGATIDEAHKGMYPNPSSMWVLNKGLGCAKCHSNKDAITSLMGKEHEPTGGSLMSWTSFKSDPSGKTGSNHVYRMERALMALETGKANKTLMSNGVIPKGEWKYANFDMDDPDGPVPSAGSDEYKEWIKKAHEVGHIDILDKTERIPNLEEGTKLWGDPAKAGFADMHRKQCGRCHVWGEGRSKRGDHRSAGCASCHVLYTNDALSESTDPTIDKDEIGHPMSHKIVTNVPSSQCTHCHTRGKRIGTSFTGIVEHQYKGSGVTAPFDEEGNPQKRLYTKEYNHVRQDLHGERGMQCADCHSSIDVHGDGNIYPVTYYQVEIGCADCHGTPQAYPWELPIGYGTKVITKKQRGSFKANGKEYLITTRGNPRTRWVKEGSKAYLVPDEKSGNKRKIPLLKNIALNKSWKTNQGHVAMEAIPQHLEQMECYACHSSWAPQCYGCHVKYDANKLGTDWPLSAENRNAQGKQTVTKAPGNISIENVGYIRWEEPILGVNYKGRVSPVIPGCQTVWTFVDKNGKLTERSKIYKTSDGHPNPTLAPVQPHTTTLVARTCESCHANPKALGYGTAKSRSAQLLEGDEKPVFAMQGFPVNADIPSSKRAKPQIPGIPEFPFAWEQLVTRKGKQIMNMPLLVDRPLNKEERSKAEREGSCIACHQYYNTSTWTKVRNNLRSLMGTNKALTPEQHDKALEIALISLSRTANVSPSDFKKKPTKKYQIKSK